MPAKLMRKARHIYESEIAAGKSPEVARRIAFATIAKQDHFRRGKSHHGGSHHIRLGGGGHGGKGHHGRRRWKRTGSQYMQEMAEEAKVGALFHIGDMIGDRVVSDDENEDEDEMTNHILEKELAPKPSSDSKSKKKAWETAAKSYSSGEESESEPESESEGESEEEEPTKTEPRFPKRVGVMIWSNITRSQTQAKDHIRNVQELQDTYHEYL